MKIRIITAAQLAYDVEVENKNFDEVVNKILEQKYLKLNEKLVILTSAISVIQKI